jgi:hypothetical protein
MTSQTFFGLKIKTFPPSSPGSNVADVMPEITIARIQNARPAVKF